MTKETAQQSLPGQMNVENQTNLNSSNDKDILSFEPIEGTPFRALENSNGWQVTIGNHVITPPYNTREELTELLERKPYEFLINVIHVIIELHEKIKNKKI